MVTTQSRLTKDSLATEIEYDRNTKRYRYIDTKQFVSREAVVNIQKRFLDQQIRELIALAPRIHAGDVGVYTKAAELLKNIHLSNAIIAARGIDNLTPSDLGTIGSILKKQYYSGVDPSTGQHFGLKYLLKDAPDQTVERVRQRLEMFAKSGEVSGSTIKGMKAVGLGYDIEKRVLGAAHVHCDDCVRYAAMGWSRLGTLPKPKTMCKCRSNCKCDLIYGKSGVDDV